MSIDLVTNTPATTAAGDAARLTEQGAVFLNHVELLHRPGEGELASQFFETLGCVIEDLTEVFGATRRIMGVFADAANSDPLNNVLYVSEFRHPDKQLDDLLARLAASNDELRTALKEHDDLRSKPGDVTHFGLRYSSVDELHEVFDRLQNRLPTDLSGHVRVFPPTAVALPALGIEASQGFVHTDVVGAGLFPFGQLIELQAQRPLPA